MSIYKLKQNKQRQGKALRKHSQHGKNAAESVI